MSGSAVSSYTIGSVPYLNGRPLMRWFWDTEEGRASGVQVVEAVPSRLAELIENGSFDVGLVSSFELLRTPGLCYAPGCGVVAEGPVLSVRLLSRVPIADIRTVALDTSSLTSVALVRILLHESYGLTPEYHHAAPNLDEMLREHDAALLSGDLGYREYDPSLHVLDLGEGWKALTGLPFVYALWIGRPDRVTPELCQRLQTAKEWGKANLLPIAEREFGRLSESYERTRRYLTEIMHYDVGDREVQALRLFGQKAFQNGLLSEMPAIREANLS
jgi:chorismate dehydratase